MNRVQLERVVKNTELKKTTQNTSDINNRIQYYKDNFKELKQYYEWDKYDQEAKFDLMDLLEEIRHEFRISCLLSQQEEYRRINPDIMDVYDGLISTIYGE